MPAPPHPEPASIEAVRRSIEYLASEDLEGRGVGTVGLESASHYIAGYFRGVGLQPPPGQKDYFQPFSYTVVSGPDVTTSLKAGEKMLELNSDFVPLANSAEKTFDGGVVFVGYGITVSKSAQTQAYDDYAGVDVKGKIALALRYEPSDGKGKSKLAEQGWSGHAGLNSKADLAAKHGAIALIIVHPPNHPDADALSPFTRNQRASSIPVIQITQKVADEWLKNAGAQDLKTFQNGIDEQFSPRSFILKKTHVAGNVALKRTTHILKNVTACLPGKGKYADQYIVLGAHYDHLGRGGPGSLARNSKAIHYGADDNASGTAAILELARLFKQTGPLPKSVLFVAFSGEEEGLLGSNYWVAHPPVPLTSIEAMINFDMVGRMKDRALIVSGAGTAAPFDAIVHAADGASAFQLKSDWRDGIAPSDIMSFVQKRIPAIFFFTGTHEDYHRPTDRPEKINYDGEAQIINLASRVLIDISRRKELTFTDPPPKTQPATTRAARGSGAGLGVIPDYGNDDAKGLKITGTSPGSAAEKAGLKAGDMLIQFGDRKITNIYDFSDALLNSSPGQKVKIIVLRDGKQVTVEATLSEPRRRD